MHGYSVFIKALSWFVKLKSAFVTLYQRLSVTFCPPFTFILRAAPQAGYNFSIEHLEEEFSAFLSGMIETGRAEEIFGLTEAENPEIFASWRDFKAAMGANPMPQTGLEGDGPVSYSLDAFPKKPDPLVNDTTADDILRDRSAVNFLTRRGGLELDSDMTQAEKRQAVKEAVERVARHSEGGNGAMFSALNPGETAEQMKPQGEEPGPSSVFKPGEEGKQQEIFKLLGDYRQPDGKFDVEASKQDYKNFLQDVPEKNRIYLKQALDAVESEVSEDPTTIFLYDGKADRIIYNPKNAIFGKYDIGVAFTHELAHRIDKYFARAAEDTRFVQAIQEAKAVIDTDPEMFIRFCKENDREGFCSDIWTQRDGSSVLTKVVDFPRKGSILPAFQCAGRMLFIRTIAQKNRPFDFAN